MDYSLLDFLTLLGSLGLFLYGMKIMSEALQKVAGGKPRNFLAAMTSKRFMGANNGTTITSWLISIPGFKVKMNVLAFPIIGIGFPLIFSKKTKNKSWGQVLVGFALLIIGLARCIKMHFRNRKS